MTFVPSLKEQQNSVLENSSVVLEKSFLIEMNCK